MKLVGAILREARERKGLSLEDVEKATKIRLKFLRAIEADDFSHIPSLVYTKGFIKNYGDFLGLDSDMILAFFRRQSEEFPKSAIVPNGIEKEIQAPMFQLTPGKFLGVLLGILVLVFLLYFGLQYRRLYQSPRLLIEKPQAEEVTEERKIDILGKTTSDAVVTINGVSTVVRSDGKFFDQVSLEPGVNTITITATSRFGKTTTIVRKVGLKQ